MVCSSYTASLVARRGGLLLTACAAAISAGGALAADLPSPRYAPAPPAAIMPYDWTGVYVGLQGGHDWGRDKTTEFFTATGAFTGLSWSYNPKGWAGGGHLGFNYQFSSLVVGVEGDLEKTGIRGGFVDPGGSGVMTMNWQGSLRARIGFAFDRALIYATGGAAVADIKYVYANPVGPISEPTSKVRNGWTLGGGAAYAFTDAISGRLEYRYSDYGRFRYNSVLAFPGLLTGEQEPRVHSLRAGVSYKF